MLCVPIQIHSFTNKVNFYVYCLLVKISQHLPLMQQHAVFLLSWTSNSVLRHCYMNERDLLILFFKNGVGFEKYGIFYTYNCDLYSYFQN
jgi:hypothetical protein